MNNTKELLYHIVLCTLAFVMIAVVAVMLVGLFDTAVDNKEIFTIIGPAFQTIVGCFVGLISAQFIRKE